MATRLSPSGPTPIYCQGQKAEIFKTSSTSSNPSYKTQEITLPNGQKVEVIRTTDPKLVPGGVPLEPGSDLGWTCTLQPKPD
ncbi:hypothetical protein D910_10103 [Dendroctonus ponderosae]|uniref:Uncharacterized protein n=1 Tax=Dendroctonus ponderosae TaxID=77166 RepID=U4URT8_DENPD|nr:hypothetical protein D910_10103 [Dendroctonus ponderosae]